METASSSSIQADFPSILRERLNTYFQLAHCSRKGNWMMISKITFGFAAVVGTYSVLYLCPLSTGQFLVVYSALGLGQLFLLLNVAHDSNHHATSSSRLINKLLSFTF